MPDAFAPINKVNQAAYMRGDAETRSPGMIVCPHCYTSIADSHLLYFIQRKSPQTVFIVCPNCKAEFKARVHETVYSANKHRKNQGEKDA